jgi:hypothetical protein
MVGLADDFRTFLLHDKAATNVRSHPRHAFIEVKGGIPVSLLLCSFRLLLTLFLHIAHHLAHGGDVPWVASLIPRLETLRRFLKMTEEALAVPHLAALLDMGFHALPDSKELSGRFKEKVFVQETVVE